MGVKLLGVAPARQEVGRWARRRLAALATGEPVALRLSLGVPTEREALANVRGVQVWVGAWREVGAPAGMTVHWVQRSWRSLGRQLLPQAISFECADAVVEFAGGQVRDDFRALAYRAALLCGAAEAAAGGAAGVAAGIIVRSNAAQLLRMTDVDVQRLVDIVGYLLEHDVAGMRPRQLPIRGVDSKWFEQHRALVTALVAAGGGTLELRPTEARIRLRILDPELAVGGLLDLQAPVVAVAALDLAPRQILVVENLETLLALPTLAGSVAIHGAGYAVDLIARLPWVRQATVRYWGDLDTHGFAILNRLRSQLPDVESFLMDEVTLLRCRDLWVSEPKPMRGILTRLRPAEQRTVALLAEYGYPRLEQERIPWELALAEVSRP